MGERLTEKDFHFVGPESVKALLAFQVVEKLSSVRGAPSFIYVFPKPTSVSALYQTYPGHNL
jgi:hypothetical protein